MKLHIHVTSEHIAKATPLSCCKCPIARTIADTPFAKAERLNASIGATHGTLARHSGAITGYVFWLPQAAQAFIATWEADPRAAEPFSFDAELEEYTPRHALDTGREEWARNRAERERITKENQA